MDQEHPVTEQQADPGNDVDADLLELRAALEGAGELALDARLELLRRAESSIARELEGLDGL